MQLERDKIAAFLQFCGIATSSGPIPIAAIDLVDGSRRYPRYFAFIPSFSKTKLTSDKNLLQPEPTPNRTAPPPTNRSNIVLAQPKLSDFTEDPFRDYRYEDPFNITDPFADETEEDLNANKNGSTEKATVATDPFGLGTISAFSGKNAVAKAFDNDFSNTFPLAKTKIEKNTVTNKFDADFGKAFFADNKNRNMETDFSQAFTNIKTKTVDLDEAFSAKGAKTVTKHESDVAHTTKSKVIYNEEKLANDFGKMWNGNNITNLSEEEQLTWARRQSMKAEKERLRRKEKEDADLALAIELSKQGKWGNV